MRLIKRLDLFILRSFLPLFAMTFFIVLFIVLMQFLWRYIDDLVGKGLGIDLIGELFFYAAVSMVPMALPLAILLASLMTFGNLGEKSELTAIKAAGVSLVRIMMPLIIFISCVAVGAFFFQNDVLPRAQVKMWTLLFSARQKSPELEIPEGAFYDQIPGYNLYVQSKNQNTGMLRGVMIYDVSHGGDNSTILMADSAQLAFTKDMRFLYLHLFQGEQFENLREQKSMDNSVPFRRETFLDKEVLIPFDANFNKLDEEAMRNQYVGKNISQLVETIDSLNVRIDSIGISNEEGFARLAFPALAADRGSVRRDILGGMSSAPGQSSQASQSDSIPPGASAPTLQPQRKKNGLLGSALMGAGKQSGNISPLNLDSLLAKMSDSERDNTYSTAINLVKMRSTEMEFRAIQMHDEKGRIRRHEIELIKKFTLSVACIIFLFIGAPLGAIIRKGGLGMPLVISVGLFLVYYIIDNTGYKLARDGHWIVWPGMWLSTFILLPLGIFVTYKAMRDSSVFNPDLYREWLRRRLGLAEKRMVTRKEVIINDIDRPHALSLIESLDSLALRWLGTHHRYASYFAYWSGAYSSAVIDLIGRRADAVVEYLSDSRSNKVIAALNKMPVVKSLWILRPVKSRRWMQIFKWIFPLGGLLWLFSLGYERRVYRDIARAHKASTRIKEALD